MKKRGGGGEKEVRGGEKSRFKKNRRQRKAYLRKKIPFAFFADGSRKNEAKEKNGAGRSQTGLLPAFFAKNTLQERVYVV